MGKSPPRDLTKLEAERLNRWPCDGKPRFSVKSVKGMLPYGQTYEAILKETESDKNDEGNLVFTPSGRRRITALNKLYFPLAKNFIGVALWRLEQEKKRQEAEEAKLRVGSVEPLPVA